MKRPRLETVATVAYVVAVLWVLRPFDGVAPRFWHSASAGAGGIARLFGRVALVAEARYWRAVGR